MTTQKQIEANRRNAQKSTGPRTEEGRRRASLNAHKHGLSGTGLVLPQDEADAINERVALWCGSLKPIDALEMWLLEVAAVEAIRVDMGQRHDLVLRGMQVERARLCWDEDRRLLAEQLGARLGNEPGLISRQLRMTVQGAEWLLGRWDGLARVLREGRDWTEAQRSLALDLLGEPAELRDGRTRVDGDCESQRALRLGIAQHEMETLAELKAGVLEDLNDRERSAAELGLGAEIEKPLQLVRRYLTASVRRLAWAWGQFKKGRRGFVEPMAADVPAYRDPAPARHHHAPEVRDGEALPGDLGPGGEPTVGERVWSAMAARAEKSGLAPAAPGDPPAPPHPSEIRMVPEGVEPAAVSDLASVLASGGVPSAALVRQSLAARGRRVEAPSRCPAG